MQRRGIAAAVTLIGVCLIGGCGSSTGPQAAVPPTSTRSAPGGTPDELVGMWRVTGAAGEAAGSVLRLDADDGFGLLLFRKCGHLHGSWAASPGGAFLGMTSGGSMACVNTTRRDGDIPLWLAQVRSYRVVGGERDLLAADGTVAARLLPGATVRPEGDLIKSLQQPPTLSPSTVQKLRAVPHPLPVGATSVTASIALGKWVPYPKRQYRNATPDVTFAKDGTWNASDGCNGTYGRWALDADGVLVTTAGPSTLIGCDGAPTGSWVSQARRAAVAGGVLTLYSVDGKVVARLTR